MREQYTPACLSADRFGRHEPREGYVRAVPQTKVWGYSLQPQTLVCGTVPLTNSQEQR